MLGRAARRALEKGKKKIERYVEKGLISRERVDELVGMVAKDKGYGESAASFARDVLGTRRAEKRDGA